MLSLWVDYVTIKRIQMNENILVLDNKKEIFWRLSAVIAPLFLFLMLFNLISVYTILGLALLAFVYVFLRRHIWVFLALAAPSLVLGKIIHFYITSSWVYEMTLAEVFILLAAAIFLLDKFLNGKIMEIKIDYLSGALLVYLAVAAASFWQIIDLRLYIFGLKVVVFSFLSYFLALNLFGDNANTANEYANTANMRMTRIKIFLGGLSLTVVVLSVQIFIKFYQMGWSSKFFFDRSNILLPIGPVATAAAILVLMLPLVLSFYFYNNKQSKTKPFLFFAFTIGAMAVFLTLGKAAILSFLAGLFYLFVKLKNKRIAFALAFSLLIILSYIFFTSFFIGLFERLSHTFIDANTKFRILEYEIGWQIIKNHFWFGVGAGQQLIFYRKMLNWENAQLVNNFLLQAFIDFGIVGFFFASAIIFGVIRKIKNIFRGIGEDNLILFYGFSASVLVAFLNGLAEVTFFALQYAIIFWLIMGAFSNLIRKEKI